MDRHKFARLFNEFTLLTNDEIAGEDVAELTEWCSLVLSGKGSLAEAVLVAFSLGAGMSEDVWFLLSCLETILEEHELDMSVEFDFFISELKKEVPKERLLLSTLVMLHQMGAGVASDVNIIEQAERVLDWNR